MLCEGGASLNVIFVPLLKVYDSPGICKTSFKNINKLVSSQNN